MQPTFFRDAPAFRRWLARHHASRTELLVGFWKTGTGRASMTWSESVDEALCFGWIDGRRQRRDDESYVIRFSPRKPTSHWSNVNVQKMEKLRAAGKMTPAGERAFAARRAERTGCASYERKTPANLAPADERRFRAAKAAWANFRAMAPSYQRTAIAWVAMAKRAETRARRLDQLIAWSAKNEVAPPYRWQSTKKRSA